MNHILILMPIRTTYINIGTPTNAKFMFIFTIMSTHTNKSAYIYEYILTPFSSLLISSYNHILLY